MADYFGKINGLPAVITVPDGPWIIEAGGERIEFEWSYPGPWPLKKNGDPRELGPRHKFWKHPFWNAVTLWDKQGRRVKDGLCVYDLPPPPPKPVHLGGKHWAASQATADAIMADIAKRKQKLRKP